MNTRSRDTDVGIGDDALGGAINRALRRPLLSAEEERRLARRAAHGDLAARDRLVEANMRLVVAIARMHRGRGVPHADLVQEGMIGVLRALESFDHERGHRFATYATWWIRRSMLLAIGTAPAIRLPAEGRRELAAILRTEQELTTHGRPRPTAGTLADRTGVPLRRVERLRAAPHVVASLDAQVAGGETTFAELLADHEVPDVSSVLERAQTRCEAVASLSRLEPRIRRILQLRFGLAGGAPLTYDDIGRRLGLTAERCRQIEAHGLRRLRALAERASLAA
jgi:RNA polymerase sigma factor (sigma-70 family)